MEFDNRIKLVLAGLFLAAIAVSYLIFSQRFSSSSVRPSPTPRPIQRVENVTQVSPTPTPVGGATGNVGVGTTKGGLPATGISTLPNTGFPEVLVGVWSASAMAAGYLLKKYSR